MVVLSICYKQNPYQPCHQDLLLHHTHGHLHLAPPTVQPPLTDFTVGHHQLVLHVVESVQLVPDVVIY